ncbi:MAG: TIR domain-containing protein [Pseudomonadota bacterium]
MTLAAIERTMAETDTSGNSAADKLKVFVSYSRAQVAFADELELALSDKGHEVLIDRHSIAKGEAFQARLGEMILACDTVVFILSDESAASEICAWEVDEASRLTKRILVVTLDDMSDGATPPPKLAGIDWIHCWANPKVPGSSQTRGFIELDKALRTDLGWLHQRTILQEQAARWQARGPTSPEGSSMLLRGNVLTEAQIWAADTPVHETIPAAVAEFLEASADAEARLKAKAEADLAAREAALKQAEKAVAEAKLATDKLSEETGRRRRAAQLGMVVATVLTMIASVLVYFAGYAELEAEKLRSQLFAGEAAKFAEEGDYGKAILLSLAGDPAAARGLLASRLQEENNSSRATLGHAFTHNRLKQTFTGHDLGALSVAFHPDGERILTGSSDGTSRLWRIGEDEPLQTFSGNRAPIISVTFHPDGERILTGSDDGTAKLWRVGEDEPLQTFSGQDSGVIYMAIHPDGERILTGSLDRTAKLWRVGEDEPLQTFSGHDGSIRSVAFHPDGERILTGSDDGTAKLWRVGEDEPLQTFTGHDGSIWSVAFHPDRGRILTGSGDNTAKLWRVGEDQPLQTFSGHDGSIRSVAFHPDGERILTGSDDGTAKLWHVGEDQPLQTFTGHEDWIWSVAFHPDGEHILTGSRDKTAKFWPIHEFLLKTAKEQVAAACDLITEIGSQPYLTDEDRQEIPILRGLSDEELDPCGLRPVDEETELAEVN